MGARFLIIEDNFANMELMSYLLVAFGHTVIRTTHGMSGVEEAYKETPDLVICDVQLPDIDGFEVARRLRGGPSPFKPPLLAVTALAMMGDRDRLLGAGFDGYLSKPIDPETFVQQVEAFLSARYHSPRHLTPFHSDMPEPKAIEQRFTVLVVDNLRVNLDLARGILAPSGYQVLTVSSVSEGLARARENGCDLILSDICLPRESGYDFLAAVRADPQLRFIPFILITSTMMGEEDRKRGLKMGANRFLRRPVEPEALLAEVRACLSRHA